MKRGNTQRVNSDLGTGRKERQKDLLASTVSVHRRQSIPGDTSARKGLREGEVEGEREREKAKMQRRFGGRRQSCAKPSRAALTSTTQLAESERNAANLHCKYGKLSVSIRFNRMAMRCGDAKLNYRESWIKPLCRALHHSADCSLSLFTETRRARTTAKVDDDGEDDVKRRQARWERKWKSSHFPARYSLLNKLINLVSKMNSSDSILF